MVFCCMTLAHGSTFFRNLKHPEITGGGLWLCHSGDVSTGFGSAMLRALAAASVGNQVQAAVGHFWIL